MKDKILQNKKSIILITLLIVAGIIVFFYQYKKKPVYVIEEGISGTLGNYSWQYNRQLKI